MAKFRFGIFGLFFALLQFAHAQSIIGCPDTNNQWSYGEPNAVCAAIWPSFSKAGSLGSGPYWNVSAGRCARYYNGASYDYGNCIVNTACPSGTVLTNGICKPGTACPAAGSTSGKSSDYKLIDGLSIHYCLNSCSYTGAGGYEYEKGHFLINGPFTSDGVSCTASASGSTGGTPGVLTTPASLTNTATGCPTGTYSGGYDSAGTPICIGSAASQSTPSTTSQTSTTGKTSTTNTDGSTTTSESSSVKNSDGSTTTQTKTCTTQTSGSSSCSTTSVTSTASSGAAGVNDKDPTTGEDTKSDQVTSVSGDLYTTKGKSFSTVMSSFSSKISNAPFMASVSSFFTVSVSSSGCPNWSVTVPYLKATVDLSQPFCSSTMNSVFSIIGIGVLISAAYTAFKMAFL